MSSGHNVRNMMGWAAAAIDRRIAGLALPFPTEPQLPPGQFGGGSPNQKLMFAVMWYVYLLFSKTKTGRLTDQRELLLTFLRQEGLCHGNTEPLTPSHAEQWIAAMGLALWAAQLAGDQAVVDALIGWWRPEFRLWDLCSDEEGVWAPGARGHGDDGRLVGSNPARDLAYRVLKGLKVRIGKDKFNVGVRALSLLSPETWAMILQAPASMPPMISSFHVRRGSGWHVAWFDAPFPVLQPTYVAGTTETGRFLIDKPDDREAIEKAGGGSPDQFKAGQLDVPRAGRLKLVEE